MKRKEGLMVAAIALALTVTGAGIERTYSYFTQKETVNNVFTVGDLDIDLEEPEWNPDDGDGKNIYPGYTVYKNPTVKNIPTKNGKTQPCYLMMKVKVLDQNGKQITDEKRLAMIRETIRYDATYNGNFSHTGAATGLVEGSENSYSLKEIQKFPMINPEFDELSATPGEWTFGYKGGKDMILRTEEEKALFTTIALPTEWNNEEMELLGEFQLEISALAIQADGFADRTEAFAALNAKQ